jgi:microcystin-dependent protein
MAEPYLAELRIFGFNFPPRGWAFCDGQILPISQNQSLYSLLGTTYGGDGRTTFALPDLRGRSAVHRGDGVTLGQKAGQEAVVLTTGEIPAHTHTVQASSDPAAAPVASARVMADSAPNENYHGPTNLVPLHAGTVANAGSGQGHDNMQPFLTLTVCIAVSGLFPNRN